METKMTFPLRLKVRRLRGKERRITKCMWISGL
jgi:hypothetical protein